MGTYRSIKEYQEVMRKRADKLRKIHTNGPSNAATFIQATAIKLAPRHTGETILGIRKYRVKKGHYAIESSVAPKGKSGFMQNFWANQSVPFRSVRMRWNRFKPTLYGRGPAVWTGTPRFFHLAALRGRGKFRDLKIGRAHV